MHKKLLLVLLIGSPLLAMDDRPVPQVMRERVSRAIEASQATEDLKDCCARCVPPCLLLVVGVPAMVIGLADAGVRAAAEKVALAPDSARKLIRKLKQKAD